MRRLVPVGVAIIMGIMFSAPLYAQDGAAGQKVFAREKCNMCHKATMNSLESVGTKLTAAQIREWIENPAEAAKNQKSTSTMKMPKKNLTKADVDNLIAYLQTLK